MKNVIKSLFSLLFIFTIVGCSEKENDNEESSNPINGTVWSYNDLENSKSVILSFITNKDFVKVTNPTKSASIKTEQGTYKYLHPELTLFYESGQIDSLKVEGNKIFSNEIVFEKQTTDSIDIPIDQYSSRIQIVDVCNDSIKGVPGVRVLFYQTQTDKNPCFEGVSNNSGYIDVILPKGNYCVYASSDDDYSNMVSNYQIAGVIKSQEDMERFPMHEYAKVGDFYYIDVNGDGIINIMDQSNYGSINLTDGIDILLVGKLETSIVIEDINIRSIHELYQKAHHLHVCIDASFAKRYNPGGEFTSFYNREIKDNNSLLESYWKCSFEAIYKINKYLKQDRNLEEYNIEARMYRAALYAQLSALFNKIPLDNEIVEYRTDSLPQQRSQDYIRNFVISELESLTVKATENIAYASRALLAREKFLGNKSLEANDIAKAIIQSGKYNLSGGSLSMAYDSYCMDVIYGFQSNNDSIGYSSLPKPCEYFPVVRLLEMYYISILTDIAKGDMNMAREYFNQLLIIEGKEAITTELSKDELSSKVYDSFNTNIKFDGVATRYLNYKSDTNLFLPIPLVIINANGWYVQNVGY